MFVLDVLMVFLYYILFQFTESARGAEVFLRPDARPEATIVAIAFALYLLWDVASWRIQADQEYQDALGDDRQADGEFGGRRIVSLAFFALFVALMVAVLAIDPQTGASVQAVDWLLLAGLLAYRVAKPLAGKVETR